VHFEGQNYWKNYEKNCFNKKFKQNILKYLSDKKIEVLKKLISNFNLLIRISSQSNGEHRLLLFFTNYSNRIHSLKHQRSVTLGFKDVRIRKLECDISYVTIVY